MTGRTTSGYDKFLKKALEKTKKECIFESLDVLQRERKLNPLCSKLENIQLEHDQKAQALKTKDDDGFRGLKLIQDYSQHITDALQDGLEVAMEVLELTKNEEISNASHMSSVTASESYKFYTVNLTNEWSKNYEIAAILFHFLMSGEEPDSHIITIIRRIWEPLYYSSMSWYELCCYMLANDDIFKYFFNRMENNAEGLKHLLHKQPHLLLFNKDPSVLMGRLREHLSEDDILKTLFTLRKQNVGTALCRNWTNLFKYLFRNSFEELIKFLSITDNYGQTLLHAGATDFTDLIDILRTTYIPKYRDELVKVFAVRDTNGKTALDLAEGLAFRQLVWLSEHVQDNKYLLYDKPKVLILFNTKEREGAEEEAFAIDNAFKSRGTYNVKLMYNQKEDDIISSIEQTAMESSSALIVILMSHGNVGTIEDCNKKSIPFPNIESAMCNSKNLKNRPKSLITQCCQQQDDVLQILSADARAFAGNKQPQLSSYVPVNPHFAAFMSSVLGEASLRGVFINKFAKEIMHCETGVSIAQLFTNTCQKMEAEGKMQIPIEQSTLKAAFCPADVYPFSN